MSRHELVFHRIVRAEAGVVAVYMGGVPPLSSAEQVSAMNELCGGIVCRNLRAY